MPETEVPIVREGPSMSLRPNPENSSTAGTPATEVSTPAESMNITPAPEQTEPSEPVLQPESSPELVELTPNPDPKDEHTGHDDDRSTDAWKVETNTTPAPIDPSEQPFDPAAINKYAKPAEEPVASQPEVINDQAPQLEPPPVQLPNQDSELPELTVDITQEVADKNKSVVTPVNPARYEEIGKAEKMDEVSHEEPATSPFAKKDEIEDDTANNSTTTQPTVGSIKFEEKATEGQKEAPSKSEAEATAALIKQIDLRLESIRRDQKSLTALKELLLQNPNLARTIADLPNIFPEGIAKEPKGKIGLR